MTADETHSGLKELCPERMLGEIRAPGFQGIPKERQNGVFPKESDFGRKEGRDGENKGREPPQEESDLGAQRKCCHGGGLMRL